MTFPGFPWPYEPCKQQTTTALFPEEPEPNTVSHTVGLKQHAERRVHIQTPFWEECVKMLMDKVWARPHSWGIITELWIHFHLPRPAQRRKKRKQGGIVHSSTPYLLLFIHK